MATKKKAEKPFLNQRFAFFGEFAIWPSYHGATPAQLARRLGAKVEDTLTDKTDVVVFGDLKGTGRAEAKKKAQKLIDAGGKKPKLTVLDETAFRAKVQVNLKGKRFAFVGGFDSSPEDHTLVLNMAQAAGGVAGEVDEDLDYLVVGNRRGPSKVALQNKAEKLNEAGAEIVKLDERAFLELVRVEKPKKAGGELDFPSFVNQLYGYVDQGKLGRALDMLRSDRFKLFSHLEEQHLVGVVRSQTGSGSVYASWLTPDGKYGCAEPSLSDCMGLQGAVCKHLLVLVVGLVRTGQLKPDQALMWIRTARGKSPAKNKQLCAETFVQYKGAEAGQVDWRPTETIPEDFYAM